jgi:site-specific DNA-methyltransferase (adenine-specific)
MKPYYDEDGITIYHGDCLEVMKQGVKVGDVMVTDPPFGIKFRSGWTGSSILNDDTTVARDVALGLWGEKPALVFGPAGDARHPKASRQPLVWWRPGSGMGDLASPWKPDYELIHVFGSGFKGTNRGPSVLKYAWDMFRGSSYHPHQKPLPLLRTLIQVCPPGSIFDPFMGSGTTLRAAKDLGRKAIGIEIEERYCEIAVQRLAQGVLAFDGKPLETP